MEDKQKKTEPRNGEYKIDWSDFANIVIEKLRIITKKYNINLRVHLSGKAEKLPLKHKHLEVLLGELVNNAIKFSGLNTNVAIRIHSATDVLHIRVSDEGIGMPEDVVPRIFDKFYQYPNEGERIPQGAGLGLSIVKEITKKYGGEIQVTSHPGQGTEIELLFNHDCR